MTYRMFAVVLTALTVAGCAGAPLALDKNASAARVAADAGLPPDSITTLHRCATAHAIAGEKSAVYQMCLYAPLAEGGVLLAFDENPGVYRVIDRLGPDSVRAVALQKLGRARQVQVHSRSGFFVFELHSDDRVWGNPAATSAAYDHMRALGIAETDPVQYVYSYHPVRFQVTH